MQKGDLQSRTIDLLRFPLILAVVFIHAYTSTRGIVATENYPAYRLVSFLLSLEIGQVAVPTFFFISGYLFFYKKASYGERLKKHVHTLIVPYIFWNLLILVLYFGAESIPALRHLFSGVNIPIRDHSFTALLGEFWDGNEWDRGNGTPILHQFWYIRNLILFGLASPLILGYLKVFRCVGVAIPLLVWMFTQGQALPIGSLAFFMAGAYFSLRETDFLPLFRRGFTAVNILYPILVVVNLFVRDDNYMLPLDRLGFILGMVFIFNLASWLLEKGKARPTPLLTGSVFFVFALHDPMLTFLRRGTVKLLSPLSDAGQIGLYLLTPLIVTAFCVGLYKLLKKYCPRALHIVMGR